MSNNTSVVLLAYTFIEPLVPAGTTAAFATVVPVGEFNVETFGIVFPVGQVLRYPNEPCGTTVKFNEYAEAVAGMPQALDVMGKVRVLAAAIDGGPNAPLNP